MLCALEDQRTFTENRIDEGEWGLIKFCKDERKVHHQPGATSGRTEAGIGRWLQQLSLAQLHGGIPDPVQAGWVYMLLISQRLCCLCTSIQLCRCLCPLALFHTQRDKDSGSYFSPRRSEFNLRAWENSVWAWGYMLAQGELEERNSKIHLNQSRDLSHNITKYQPYSDMR